MNGLELQLQLGEDFARRARAVAFPARRREHLGQRGGGVDGAAERKRGERRAAGAVRQFVGQPRRLGRGCLRAREGGAERGALRAEEVEGALVVGGAVAPRLLTAGLASRLLQELGESAD